MPTPQSPGPHRLLYDAAVSRNYCSASCSYTKRMAKAFSLLQSGNQVSRSELCFSSPLIVMHITSFSYGSLDSSQFVQSGPGPFGLGNGFFGAFISPRVAS